MIGSCKGGELVGKEKEKKKKEKNFVARKVN